jgi:hypothetical protein
MSTPEIDWAKKAEEDLAYEPKNHLAELFEQLNKQPLRPDTIFMDQQTYNDIVSWQNETRYTSST